MNILITAGPTREYIDPVRFISNDSTGLMGYSIAIEALRRGHKVILISGPVNLTAPHGAKLVNIISAEQMHSAVKKFIKISDCVIMAAAVADFKPCEQKKAKIKKPIGDLKLLKTPDILAELGAKKQRKILVGFALETEKLEYNARKKLDSKNLDIIIANPAGRNKPFGKNGREFMIIERSGPAEKFKDITKRQIAKVILNKIESMAT